MKKNQNTNELTSKYKFLGPNVIRVTIKDQDFTFVPGESYEKLPESDYVFALYKQGYFEEVSTVQKSES